MPAAPPVRTLLACGFTLLGALAARADSNIVVTATANSTYTARKFAGSSVRAESYVFGEGKFFGGIRRDSSLDKKSFREIAESLAPELARHQYWPAKDLKNADLLIVVHWGVTMPHQSMRDSMGITTLSFDPRDTPHNENIAANELLKDTSTSSGDTSTSEAPPTAESLNSWEYAPALDTIRDFSDEAARNFSQASNAQLLGYTRALRRLDKGAFSNAELDVLRNDLTSERYLIILCAYDLHTPLGPGQKRRPVWMTYLNVGSGGTNFTIAMNRMGQVGGDFFGKNSELPTTVTPKVREGKAIPGPLIILGMEEPTSKSGK